MAPEVSKNPLQTAAKLSNQRELVFQVWPKLNFEAHKQMRKLQKERQLLSDVPEEEENE